VAPATGDHLRRLGFRGFLQIEEHLEKFPALFSPNPKESSSISLHVPRDAGVSFKS
jgi:hypothetical protein